MITLLSCQSLEGGLWAKANFLASGTARWLLVRKVRFQCHVLIWGICRELLLITQGTFVLWYKVPLWNYECRNWLSRWQWWGEVTGGWMKLCVCTSLCMPRCASLFRGWVRPRLKRLCSPSILSYFSLCQVNSNILLHGTLFPIMYTKSLGI